MPVVNEKEIARVLSLRPQLAAPLRLTVYFRSGVPWTGADKDAVITKLNSFVEKQAISQVIPIADSIVGSEDLKAVRLAAARYGADAVLVVNGAGQIDRYNNIGSVLYWTVVGIFVVPGTNADALFLASATLWDVRNETLYASAEADGTDHATGTPFTVDDKRVMSAARLNATRALGQELESRLRRLTGTPGSVEVD
jgi:rhombotail lipoprotein